MLQATLEHHTNVGLLDTAMSKSRKTYRAFNPYPKAKKKKTPSAPGPGAIRTAERFYFAHTTKGVQNTNRSGKYTEDKELRKDFSAPENRLLEAMVERACMDLTPNTQITNYQRREAAAWLLSRSITPFSFLWICSQLEFTSQFVIRLRDMARAAVR